MVTEILRGDVVLVDFNPVLGSEQAGMRPAVVVQTNRANASSPCTIVAPCTTKIRSTMLPSHVALRAGEADLPHDSIVLCEQLRAIDKRRVVKIYGQCSGETINALNNALITILELTL
jgi:mRNA interferase MazF